MCIQNIEKDRQEHLPCSLLNTLLTTTYKFTSKQLLIIHLVSWVAPVIIRLLGWLCRYKVEGEHHLQLAEKNGKGVILSIWHGRMLLLIYHLRSRGVIGLASSSFDGELIAKAVNRLGFFTHRGSPKEGGREGFKAMLRELDSHKIVSMFPDGPTGPIHSMRDGTVHLARLSGAPIIPALFSANPCWQARSWDRFMIMKPFSRGIIKFGEPIYIPRKFNKDNDLNFYSELIRGQMIELENELDNRISLEKKR